MNQPKKKNNNPDDVHMEIGINEVIFGGNIDAAVSTTRTICEVHRELYRKINSLLESGEIEDELHQYFVSRLKEAFTYGKKMNNKLRQYSNKYDEGWWKVNRLAGGELSDT